MLVWKLRDGADTLRRKEGGKLIVRITQLERARTMVKQVTPRRPKRCSCGDQVVDEPMWTVNHHKAGLPRKFYGCMICFSTMDDFIIRNHIDRAL
jgi:hypothetical protein